MKRTQLKRKTPLRSIGRKAKREAPSLREFRRAVRERAGGMCQAHTPACPPGRHEGSDAHHLCHADRRRGVHDPARGLFVCRLGHQWIEAHPEESYRKGWLLRSAA